LVIQRDITITNCTIAWNGAFGVGGGSYFRIHNPTITNCIFWMNTAPNASEIGIYYLSCLTINYSDVGMGGLALPWVEIGPDADLTGGLGIISSDPLFAGLDDFHLTAGSPCIDAGNPDSSYYDVCFPPSMGAERNDMGAYGGPGACYFDLDGDGYYDGMDCDDSDPLINPDAEEVCDAVDHDCSGDPYDKDADDDGYGDMACGGDDCDDTNPDVNPGAEEVCGNGIDDDCDWAVDYDDPDCFVFSLELEALYWAGYLSLTYTIRAPEAATWANYLVLITPSVQVIPLWAVPLEIMYPPIEIPVAFPFPSLGWVGIWTGLFTAGGPQAVKLAWVDTGVPTR